VLFSSIAKVHLCAVHLIVFGNNWSETNIRLIKSLETSLASVEIREVDALQFKNVRLKNGFPLATAYNVIAPLCLLQDQTRAIYMDADIVVTEDLSSLWNRELSTPIGAVVDAHIAWMASPSMWRPWREEGLEPLSPYLNTGLMLMDLKRWRGEQLTEQTLAYLEKYELPCVDQDALNLVLRGKFDKLHPRYNSMPYHHLKMLRYLDTVESDEVIGEAITDPAVIHFHRSFFGKPWTYGSTHPGKKLWRALADEVHPGWRKELDIVNSARSFAARLTGMTTVDIRSADYTMSMLKMTKGTL